MGNVNQRLRLALQPRSGTPQCSRRIADPSRLSAGNIGRLQNAPEHSTEKGIRKTLINQPLAATGHVNGEITGIQRVDAAEFNPALQRKAFSRNTYVIAGTRRSEETSWLFDQTMRFGSEDSSDQIARCRIDRQHENELALALPRHAIKVVTVIAPNLSGNRNNPRHQTHALRRAASRADWYIACWVATRKKAERSSASSAMDSA